MHHFVDFVIWMRKEKTAFTRRSNWTFWMPKNKLHFLQRTGWERTAKERTDCVARNVWRRLFQLSVRYFCLRVSAHFYSSKRRYAFQGAHSCRSLLCCHSNLFSWSIKSIEYWKHRDRFVKVKIYFSAGNAPLSRHNYIRYKSIALTCRRRVYDISAYTNQWHACQTPRIWWLVKFQCTTSTDDNSEAYNLLSARKKLLRVHFTQQKKQGVWSHSLLETKKEKKVQKVQRGGFLVDNRFPPTETRVGWVWRCGECGVGTGRPGVAGQVESRVKIDKNTFLSARHEPAQCEARLVQSP